MAKKNTRSQRWLNGVSKAQVNMEELREAADVAKEKLADVLLSLEEVKEVQAEYLEWFDNMPEGLQRSPTAEKLEEIINLDFESIGEDALDFDGALCEVEDLLSEAEGVDFPLGFGRD